MSTFVPKKTVAAVIALTVAVWLVGAALVVPARAQTVAELQAQINALLAQIAALQAQLAGASGGCYNFTRDLYVGVSGDDVKALQDYLTSTGHFTFSGGSTGYFGPITQSAVAAWQAANGVSPAAGYFGPISRAKYNSLCTPTTQPESGTGTQPEATLSGGEGFFGSFELLGDPASETVYEADTQKVIGVKYEAEASDLRVERVRVRFSETGSLDDKPWKYFKEIVLYHGNTEVARESADSSSDWSDVSTTTSKTYEKTFSGLKEITKQDTESEWYVEVVTLTTIDSANDGAVWTVSFEPDSVRAVGATGVDATGPSSQLKETFTINTASQGKLELGSPSGDENDDRVQQISDTTETSDVTLFTWTMEAKEGNVLVTDLAVDVSTSSSYSNTGSVGDMLASLTLYRDGTVVKTESVASTATNTTITFDKIDKTINSGDKETWSVKGKVRKGNTATFADGDVVVLDIDNADVTAEAANGDSITPTGGTVTGGVVAFYTKGVKLAFVSSSAIKSIDGASGGVDDQGKFTINFDVTAFGSDIYIPKNATSATIGIGSTTGVEYAVTTTTGNLTFGQSAVTTWSGTDGSNGTFKLINGQTKRLTLEVYVDASTGSAEPVYVVLDRLVWATSDTTTSVGAYNFDLSEFKTGSVSLTPR